MAQIDLSTLLQGATLAVLLWFGRNFINLREEVVRLRVVLTGDDGTNGVRGDVKGLRAASHKHGDEIHGLKGRMALVEHEVAELREAA